jgi:hypothetical protein
MRYLKDTELLVLKRAHDAVCREWELVKGEFYARKYSPNQPRVPAGTREGGQWTSDGAGGVLGNGGGSTSRVRLADAGNVLGSPVMSDATPDPVIPGSQYAQAVIDKFDKTGDPRIDSKTETLMQALARAHALVGEGAGPVYGIMVHGAFGSDVKSQNLPGIGRDGVEQSFSLGDVARYGLDGSIRTDVVLRNINSPNGEPIAIWDVKTGDARLSGSRVQEIRDQVRIGREVPVIELHIKRGVTTKGQVGPTHCFAVIAARIWGSCLLDNCDLLAIH